MKVIRNLKGEVVRTENENSDRWWRIPREVMLVVLGSFFYLFGRYGPEQTVMPILRFFDIRDWTWRHLLLVSVAAGFLFSCWWIKRNWDDYSYTEEKRAKNYIGFGATATAILSFLLILSVTGRFSLFFRPVIAMFSSGRFSSSGLWRLALIVASSGPLIYFGKEWVLSFWEE